MSVCEFKEPQSKSFSNHSCTKGQGGRQCTRAPPRASKLSVSQGCFSTCKGHVGWM